jgi:hypothetical protein
MPNSGAVSLLRSRLLSLSALSLSLSLFPRPSLILFLAQETLFDVEGNEREDAIDEEEELQKPTR